jgi:hypothetical protein
MPRPKLAILDVKAAVDEFRDCVVEVFIEDDFLNHVLTTLIDNLVDWECGEVYIEEMAKEIITVYDFEEGSKEAYCIRTGITKLAAKIIDAIEHADLVDSSSLNYEFKKTMGGAVLLKSTL